MKLDQDHKRLTNAEISAMSDTDLLDLQAGYGEMLGAMQQIQQTLRSNKERIKNELRVRREGGRMKGTVMVSDHAVVRYLERHKGIDVAAIRDELRQIATRAKFERYQKRNAGLFVGEGGERLVYSNDRNSIATVLSPMTANLLSPTTPPVSGTTPATDQLDEPTPRISASTDKGE